MMRRKATPAAIARRMATQFWGAVQRQCKLAPGIWWFTTAGHGGLVVDTDVRPELAKFNSEVSRNGLLYCDEQHFAAFEEDCMAAIVEWTYPDIMPAIHRKICTLDEGPTETFVSERIETLRESLQRWYPDWLEKWPEPGTKKEEEVEKHENQ